MDIKEIRKNAPNGATHYQMLKYAGCIYFKYIDSKPYWFHRKDEVWIEDREDVDINPLYP